MFDGAEDGGCLFAECLAINVLKKGYIWKVFVIPVNEQREWIDEYGNKRIAIKSS